MRFSPHHRFIWANSELEFDELQQLGQKANGWEFDEEMQEIEESLDSGRTELLISHENLFLFLIMIIVVIFMGMLWSYTKK